ncbi:hypothetical protein NDU88_002227 [Pleurodeles waltl]|uniref:Uncharacterized protein n=1 Tax=Pleurodeles waltl TaxID=8319 RepID=A0AAV7LFD1_PLEWA|nr:hypothetical protein NDU88_002227 [Pleurodeles waltl]
MADVIQTSHLCCIAIRSSAWFNIDLNCVVAEALLTSDARRECTGWLAAEQGVAGEERSASKDMSRLGGASFGTSCVVLAGIHRSSSLSASRASCQLVCQTQVSGSHRGFARLLVCLLATEEA